MHRTWIIARKDLADVLGSRSTYLYIFVMLLASSSYFFSYFSLANTLTRQGASPEALLATSRSFLTSIAYIIPVMYCFFSCQTSISIVVLEKTKKTMESLMATPATIREIWLGKAIAVAISGVTVGLAVSLFAYLVISLGEVAPRVHQVIAPPALAIVSGLIVVPILVLSLIVLITYMQLLVSNPRVSNIVFVGVFLLVLGVLLVAVYSLPGGGLNPRYYVPIFLGLAAVVGLASYALSPRLTKERVVRSTKGL
jgi:ABC-2 type transport system permease protein